MVFERQLSATGSLWLSSSGVQKNPDRVDSRFVFEAVGAAAVFFWWTERTDFSGDSTFRLKVWASLAAIALHERKRDLSFPKGRSRERVPG